MLNLVQDCRRNGALVDILLIAMIVLPMSFVFHARSVEAESGMILLHGEVPSYDNHTESAGMADKPGCAIAENQIVGTWKLMSMTYRDESTGMETDLWGKDPIGFLSYTHGGRMSAVITARNLKIAAQTAGEASIEEQAKLFRNSFGYAGSYTLTKDRIVHHVEVATDPTWVGQDQVRFPRFDGNRLIITGEPIRTAGDPTPRVLQLIWERIE